MNNTDTPARGKHGCYVHVELWGSMPPYNQHARKSSRHEAPRYEVRPGMDGPPAMLTTAVCTRCGATVERTRDGNNVREVWTI